MKKIKVAAGIIFHKALSGPIEVSVDFTRRCTMDCLMCWWWSPLLKSRPSGEWLSKEITFDLYSQLIKDFKKMAVRRIILGGQGEPFLYPKLFEAIELAKESDIEVAIITAGVFFNEDNIKAILKLKVDALDVSLHAATPSTYIKIHPYQKETVFFKIKDQLLLLSNLKKAYHQKLPRVQLIDVICNLNYQDTVKIIEFAREVGAEAVGFKRMDVLEETKGLLLSNTESEGLKVLIAQAKNKAIELGVATSLDFYEKYIWGGLTTGIYTHNYYMKVPCYVGWLSARILSDASVIPCCGCYDVILGNIHRASFREIWNSCEYREFRKQSINISKNPQLNKRCNCSSCIELEFNLGIYRKLNPFSFRGNI